MAIDHRKLFKAYMISVVNTEGVTFHYGISENCEMNDEEVDFVNEIFEEVKEHFKGEEI